MSRALCETWDSTTPSLEGFPYHAAQQPLVRHPPDCNFLLDKPPTSEHNLAQVLGPFLFPVRKT
jgi:hypothetical protein